MKKIVYCTPSLYIAGGVERVLTTEVNWLAENTDHDITIILTDGDDKKPYYPLSPKIHIINLNINFEQIWGKSFLKKGLIYLNLQRKYKKELTRTLLEIRPDITISLLRREINFICDIKDGSKKFGWLHITRGNYRNFEPGQTNFIKDLFSKFWMSSLIHQLKKLDQFIVLTEEDKKNWSEIEKVIAIPNPLPFITEKRSKLTRKQVLSVGRYSHEKGYDMLLEAWSIVHKKHPDWVLQTYGSGNKEPIEELAKHLNLGGSCIINGPTDNIIDKYCESSLYVLSSRFEGFGMVLVEAMSCGLPCVSFACPCGPKEILDNGQTGLLAENGNIQDLADKINQVIENQDLLLNLRQKALMKTNAYKIEIIMKQWLNLLNN
ncbi:MAG: glycosyltransferase family 4 protein [Bacteroidaceae bacterium]|nr:glycosyltransferase family 4 protein [Bacteroidaceae bacterium]